MSVSIGVLWPNPPGLTRFIFKSSLSAHARYFNQLAARCPVGHDAGGPFWRLGAPHIQPVSVVTSSVRPPRRVVRQP